jgi:ankyrin repeat protein
MSENYQQAIDIIARINYNSNEEIREQLTQLLRDDNSLLTMQDEQNRTLLHHAAMYNNVTATEVLIEEGIDVNALDSFNCSAIFCAISNYSESIVRLLLENGANPNEVNLLGDNLFLQTINREELGIINVLLEFNADPHARGAAGYEPLHYAIETNNN